MDVIAGAGFGIQVNSIHNPKDPFYKHGLSILNQKQWLVAIICKCKKTFAIRTRQLTHFVAICYSHTVSVIL